jgi:repressor LexA
MNMGERIKQLRIANGLTQEELGKYIGVQKAAIRKYEKGEVKNMKRTSIQILSNLFKVSPSYLMCIDEKNSSSLNNKDYFSIPLISEYNENLETSIKKSFVKEITLTDSLPQNTFALQINDNSMLPLLGIGDIAIITETFDFESGQTCLILNNDIIMIRKVTKIDNEYELQAMNPYYPVEKTKELKILGRVIKAENNSAFK